MGIFTNFDKYMRQKSANFVRNEFHDAKYQNVRPIFAAARKNIFGKVVILPFMGVRHKRVYFGTAFTSDSISDINKKKKRQLFVLSVKS